MVSFSLEPGSTLFCLRLNITSFTDRFLQHVLEGGCGQGGFSAGGCGLSGRGGRSGGSGQGGCSAGCGQDGYLGGCGWVGFSAGCGQEEAFSVIHPPLTGRTPGSIHLLIEEYLMQILWELLGLSYEADPDLATVEEGEGRTHLDWAAHPPERG